jgi:hypothetical protein
VDNQISPGILATGKEVLGARLDQFRELDLVSAIGRERQRAIARGDPVAHCPGKDI